MTHVTSHVASNHTPAFRSNYDASSCPDVGDERFTTSTIRRPPSGHVTSVARGKGRTSVVVLISDDDKCIGVIKK